MTSPGTILVVRLGAMGDILHALPAVGSLKTSFPNSKLIWLVSSKWKPLLRGNPFIDQVLELDRGTLRQLHEIKPDIAIDFQGLVKSALLARLARPDRLFGFDRSVAREPLASWLYTDRVRISGPHRIQRNLQLVQSAGANSVVESSWIPEGFPDKSLPQSPFILASPFAGWGSKQWPLSSYEELGRLLKNEGLSLIINVSRERLGDIKGLSNVVLHSSSLEELIFATRRALAVVGVDSGPLHLAAALRKPGVAIYGLTDPKQTGPFGGSMRVLRALEVPTTYKRSEAIHKSMTVISPQTVFEVLLASLSSSNLMAAGRENR